MDYYNDKYERIIVQDSSDDFGKKFVDIVVKGNKIYKVTNHIYKIGFEQLSWTIHNYVVNQNFILKSASKSCKEIVLYQQLSDSYIVINSIENDKGQFYEVEVVVPVEIANI